MAISTTERDQRVDLRVSAKEAVTKRQTLTLTPRDWRTFLSGLEKPGRRRPRLGAAAKRYLGRRTTRGERLR